eukprot:TRINITY_DN73998_c0_g1_i1.p1 TRINITY_DN73998_c0_g1~~TRINITY_DN73998_c0_g1_i1.p1  ORF type:complete len:860 (-),score=120.17 TRINITY_DN73998_c0_g1_i1:81-2570(-)
MAKKPKLARINPLNVELSKTPGVDEGSQAKNELKDLSEKIQKDIRSEIKSVGGSIQTAVVTEVRALVQHFHKEVGERYDVIRESSSPQPKIQEWGEFDLSCKQHTSSRVLRMDEPVFGQNDHSQLVKQNLPRGVPAKAQFAEVALPRKSQLHMQGSSFSLPGAGGSALYSSSPWENSCTGKVGELELRKTGVSRHKHRKEPKEMLVSKSGENDISRDGTKPLVLPEKAPAMLRLNCPPQPPEVDLEAGQGGKFRSQSLDVDPTHGAVAGLPPCSQACLPTQDSKRDFVENLACFSDVSDCSSSDASLCEVRNSRRHTVTDTFQLSEKITNRLTITRELAKHKPKREKAKKCFWQMSVQEILASPYFDNLVGVVIMVNAAFIGIQTNHTAKTLSPEPPFGIEAMELPFAVWFTTELALRVYVEKLAFFSPRIRGWIWNWFDFGVVSAQLLEIAVDQIAKNSSFDASNFRLLRILRVLRLVRILRVVRVLHLISELRVIVSSIIGSLQSLGWTCVLLLLMIYIVAVFFTQSISQHLMEKREEGRSFTEGEEKLTLYFSSLLRAILSLWQAMSGGLDWDEVAGPLFSDVSAFHGLCFASYIAFALLALMNVVTGVFVQTALLSAQNEEDAFMTDQIVSMFKMSERKDMTICLEEIEESLHNPSTAKDWLSIGVGEADARYLFRLLDTDGSGRVSFEEFLGGALRLNGSAKAVDLLTVMQETRKTHEALFESLDKVQKAISSVSISVAILQTQSSRRRSSGNFRRPSQDCSLSAGIQFLVDAARESQNERGRFEDIEGTLSSIQQSLEKLQSFEALLSNVPCHPIGPQDEGVV